MSVTASTPDLLVADGAIQIPMLPMTKSRPRHGQLHLDAFGLNASVEETLLASLSNAETSWADTTRRILDIVFSMATLLLTLPLLLLLACLIKLDSTGPALYRQERVGLHGRSFWLLKLRSMRIDAEAAGPRWAASRDPRVTRLGRILRLTRMDELPQLLNVLGGSMSLVGPRPERPCFVRHLTEIVPHFGERIRVKPGITGWAQVNYPFCATVEDAREKLAYDLYYLRHRTLVLDLRILLATAWVVVTGSGAR